MNYLKTVLFTAALIIGTSFMNAQNIVAHINTQDLIDAMPEIIAARVELEKFAQTYQTDIQSMSTAYEVKIKRYQAEKGKETLYENKKRLEEITGIEEMIRQFQFNAQGKLDAKQAELFEPIHKKAIEAIVKVARAQGIQYVLDSIPGQGVIPLDGKDLLADVKSHLGL